MAPLLLLWLAGSGRLPLRLTCRRRVQMVRGMERQQSSGLRRWRTLPVELVVTPCRAAACTRRLWQKVQLVVVILLGH